MERNKELDEILSLTGSHRLAVALERLESFGCKYPELGIGDTVAEIKNDYRRMADYWANGYRDPQLQEIYSGLEKRLYRLTVDTMLRHAIAHSTYFSVAARRIMASWHDWSFPAIQSKLEEFVSDVALLELDPANVREAKKTDIYSRHYAFMSDLFDYLWLSGQWTDGAAEAFGRLILSPTVDSTDQQLMVSAITLSAMNIFDMNKLELLVRVYMESGDENVRQRALVGIALSSGGDRYGIFADTDTPVRKLLSDDNACRELTELQIQLFYCVSAESDNKTIQKEIIPDLLKHNNFNITRFGIEEGEEDSMRDILDPEASERSMDKVEESFRRMIDMQKAGSDIYFGGFSQMKRFPFFENISNWFVPFFPEHPAIAPIYSDEKDAKIVRMIIDSGPFCNSDKYSFVLVFRQVMDRIPRSMREMIGRGEAVSIGQMMDLDRQSAAYIRRIYLQDIYRFFRLFPSRSLFYNPFDYRQDENWDSGYVFFADRLYREEALADRFDEIASFLVSRKMYREAAEVLDNWPAGSKGYNYYMLCGNVLMHSNETIMHTHLSGATALGSFERALALKPDDAKALMGYARACFREERYADAAEAYSRLLAAEPDRRSLLLGHSVCLTGMGSYTEALKTLYRLDYEYPGDKSIRRVLGRALTGEGKFEQARKIYMQLTDDDKVVAEDFVNFGYCEWFSGNNREAARLFARYLKLRYPDSALSFYRERAETEIIDGEKDFISGHVEAYTEIQLMLDLICDEIFL